MEGLWNVPFERNVYFTGRDGVLEQLHERLQTESNAAISQAAAICGLGGIGKTQTAVEYAYRYQDEYDAVFWVRAETTTELTAGFLEIAQLLKLPEAQDPQETVAAVKRWLEKHENWLLIFDNADHPELLKPYRPRQAKGQQLLTSRAHNFSAIGIRSPLPLEQMDPAEAVKFLLKRTEREAMTAEGEAGEHGAVTQLAAVLDYFPLALEQAAAYIREQGARFQDYLVSYQNRKIEVLERSGPEVGGYPASIATTWELNFQQVEAESLAAADLLKASAFLSPDAIPYELIIEGAEQLGERIAEALQTVEEDPLVVSQLLSPLARYSLIRLEPSRETYSIYRLVQEVVRTKLDATQYQEWSERTIDAITQAFPNSRYGNWSQCEQLLAHAQTAIQWLQPLSIESENIALMLARTASYLQDRTQYIEAEPLYVQALEMNQRLLGEEHPDVARSLNNLATLYDSQGRLSEAEPLYVQALEMRKRLLGEEHPNLARSLNNLAALYRAQGRLSEAEPLYVQALEMRKRLLGEEHPDVAGSLNNLALLYQAQGRLSEAEPLYVQALEMNQRLLGEEHPNLARSLNNLAALYRAQGRLSEAEPLYVQALEMRKRLLGEEHPDVARSLNNLAALYDSQGRLSKAEPLYIQALKMRKRLLGEEHPDVAGSLNNLAYLYQAQGRLSEAEPLYVQVLEMRKRLLGEEHPDVARSLNNLAVLYESQGRLSEAEPLLVQALEMRKRLLGEGHPDVALSLNNLAFLYGSQGDFTRAEPLLAEAVKISQQTLGKDHPDTQSRRTNLEFCRQQLHSQPDQG